MSDSFGVTQLAHRQISGNLKERGDFIAPALFVGCSGPAVAAWQRIVGTSPDGVFGGATQTATRAWQGTRGLPQTGIVCMPELIAAGLATDPSPPAAA